MSEDGQTVVPKLRFPEFRGSPAWKSDKVDALVDTVTPPKKLPTSSYSQHGEFPIIDQSQSQFCGWTDDQEALIRDALPLVVFGDHTCVLKLVVSPFAQGADGIKILSPCAAIDPTYLYQFLSCRPLATEEYKRHFSILKEKVVLFPDRKTGEQQKIADCLNSLDGLIAAQTQKLAALTAQKTGLMQQLFPRGGEVEPRMRFNEFQNAGEWPERSAGSLFYQRSEKGEDGLPIYSITINEGMVRRDSLDRKIDDIEEAAGNKKVFRNDIAYNMMRMWQGAMGVAAEDCLVSPAYVVLAPKEDAVPHFFQYLFKLPAMLQLLTSHSRGLTKDRLRLYFDDFARMTFRCPSSAEQLRIANFLRAVDDHIASQIKNLEALKAHKMGLMQQLFPSTDTLDA